MKNPCAAACDANRSDFAIWPGFAALWMRFGEREDALHGARSQVIPQALAWPFPHRSSSEKVLEATNCLTHSPPAKGDMQPQVPTALQSLSKRMGRFEGCRSAFFLCQGLTIMLTWMPTVEAASFFSLLYLIVNINLKGTPKTLQRWIKTEQWWSCFAKRLSVIIILSGRSAGAAVGNTDYRGKRWQMLNV